MGHGRIPERKRHKHAQHLGARWEASQRRKVEREIEYMVKKREVQTDNEGEITGIRRGGNNEYGSLPGYRSKVTPSVSPLGPLRVSWELRGTLVSTTLPVEVTGGRMRETQPCLVNYTYIPPSDTHTQTQVTPHSLLCQPFLKPFWVSILFFCWPVCGRVDRGEHTISQRPNTENWITPRVTFLVQCLAYLHPVLSRGPFRADVDPCLAPGVRCSSALAAGQHDNLYKTLSNTWLTHTRPSPPTFTPAPANYPKTQTDDHVLAPYLLSCHLPYVAHTHMHVHVHEHTQAHTHTHSVLSWEPLCQHKAGFILQ